MANGSGSAGSIFIDLLLRDSKYEAGLARSRQNTKRFTTTVSGDLTALSRSFSNVINPVTNLSNAIKSLGLSVASFLSVQKIVEISDQYRQLSSRLSIVVAETESFTGIQQELYEIAIRTRQPLENIYNLYTRLAQAVPDSQKGQYNLLEITESINQALAITGEGSAQAASAVLQFTQAAASGFQSSGAEINTLLDTAPRLAKALQNSFGDGRKSLKQLSEEGSLSLDRIFLGLQKTSGQAQILQEEFDKTATTVGQALSNLKTSFTQFIGNNEGVSTATKVLAMEIQALADVFETLNERIDRGVFLLQKFLSQPGDFTPVTQDMFDKVLPPQLTTYSEGEIQAAIDMAKRLQEPAKQTKKQQQEAERAAKKAQSEALKNQRELESLYEKNLEYITGLDKETLSYIETEKELNRLYDERLISYDQLFTALNNLDEKYDESTKKVNQFGIDTEAFGKKAAENIQDAFAEFLFDPFQDGLDGMLKGFIDTVRKMIAEAQAAQLAKYLFGEMAGGEKGDGGILGGIFGSLGGGGGEDTGGWFDGWFAGGGFIEPGKFGVVGEGGGMQHAELLYGGRSGVTVTPSSKMGGNVYNIDARGADQGAVRRMEQALLALAGPGVVEQRVNIAQARGEI